MSGLRARVRRPRLRTQLVALLVSLLAVTFVLVAVVTVLALRHFLDQRLDQELHAAGDRFSASLEQPDDHDADNDAGFGDVSGQAEGTLGARVLNGRVTAAVVVGHDRDDRRIVIGPAARAVLVRLTPSREPRTLGVPDLGRYRILVSRGDDGDVLVTGLPTHPVDDTIEHLVTIEAIVFGVALVVVAAAGTGFVRLATRPLDRVAQTATRVADLPLSSGDVSLPERVPERPPHTEVGALSHAFNQMLAHVESSLHRRQAGEERLRRFIADASHELRTPVAVMRGYAELALRGDQALSPDTETALQRIGAEAIRMGHLVDELLVLARFDADRAVDRVEVDVTRVVMDAVRDAQVAGPDHVWHLDLPEEPLTALTDQQGLHQILANLLANARTHTPAGTTVLTALTATSEGLEVSVTDDGVGIPAAVLPGIFERFVRADTKRSSTTGSSGLGLAIVDTVTRRLGGTVTVRSRPGHTRFSVRLPSGDGDGGASMRRSG